MSEGEREAGGGAKKDCKQRDGERAHRLKTLVSVWLEGQVGAGG